MNTAHPPFIVDNSEADWQVRNYLREWCGLSRKIDIATGYFEIGALLCLDDEWRKVDKIRLLMGDEVSRRTKSVSRRVYGGSVRRWTAVLRPRRRRTISLKASPHR